jgi:hypothetical protein
MWDDDRAFYCTLNITHYRGWAGNDAWNVNWITAIKILQSQMTFIQRLYDVQQQNHDNSVTIL